MNTLILALFFILIVYLILRSTKQADPAAEDCAKELIQVLRDKHDTSPEELATIFRAHGRTRQDAGSVAVLVKARLHQANIKKEEHDDVIRRVIKAKSYLDE